MLLHLGSIFHLQIRFFLGLENNTNRGAIVVCLPNDGFYDPLPFLV